MSDSITRLNTALSGRYHIERELGQGGMATVYLADDLKHDRKVALKVLKPELAAVVGAERFLAEIRTTANLQHPHILPLFDSGEADSFLYYVMPYVEGESLREKLDRENQLPVDEAIGIAVKVAGALGAAHQRGVIHRDIKPANILLAGDEPLVADFGIALALGVAGGTRLTETGLSLGTPYYMSPEQATGDQQVGPPSDIYSLACVLYEMLVGEPPYVGPTAQAVLGKIIAGEATAPSRLRPTIPPNVDAALRGALEKLPADRFTTAGEFAKALGDPAFRHREAILGATAAPTRPWLLDPRSWAALVAILALSSLWMMGQGSDPANGADSSGLVRSFIGETHLLTWGAPAAISPDGETVVFVGGEGLERRLYRRRLDDLVTTPIAGTEGAQNPVFSPDGEWLAFTRAWGLEKVRLLGGSVVPVLGEGVGTGAGISWGPDGSIVFYPMGDRGVAAVPAAGGEIARIEVSEADGERNLSWWSHLPGGGSLLVTDWRGVPHMGVLDVGTGALRVDTTREVSAPHFVPPGTLVFGRPDGTLLAAPFDPERAVITGPPVPLATDVEVTNWMPQFAVSEAGTIVYVLDEPDELVWESPEGSTRPFTEERRNFRMTVSLSPDGSRVLVPVRDGSGDQIRVYDALGRGENLTRDERVIAPIWSGDGQWITYGNFDQGILRRPAAGSGEPELLVQGIGMWQPSSWSPNGERLAYMNLNDYRPMVFDAASGTSSPFSEGTDGVGAVEYSPDGSMVAFQSRHLEGLQIWIQRVDKGVPLGPLTRVSREGGIAPIWSRDGRTLYYIRWRMEEPQIAHLMSVEVERTPETAIGAHTEVADWSGQGIDSAYRFDLHPNGDIIRIVFSPKRKLVLLQNWLQLVGDANR